MRLMAPRKSGGEVEAKQQNSRKSLKIIDFHQKSSKINEINGNHDFHENEMSVTLQPLECFGIIFNVRNEQNSRSR